MCPNECAGFSDTLEEANCHYGLRLLGRRCYHRKTGPNTHHKWKENSRLDIVQREIRRDLSDDIANGETCVDFVVLVTDESELLFHTRDVRIGQI